MKQTLIAGVLGALIWARVGADAGAATRTIPRPLPSHPGNIFLVGETVTVPTLPAGDGDTWRAVDYEGRTVAQGPTSRRSCVRQVLPISTAK